MTKQMLNFLGKFIDNKNPKFELNYAYIDFNKRKIVATNTRMLVEINIPFDNMKNCSGVYFLHKKVVKAMESLATKEAEYKFEDNCLFIDEVKISVDTVQEDCADGWTYPDYERILNGTEYDDSFRTESIQQVDFELSKLDSFVNGSYLYGIMELNDIPNYEVFYKKQHANNGSQVKIVANDSNSILFQVVYMGEYFTPSVSNQSIMNFEP